MIWLKNEINQRFYLLSAMPLIYIIMADFFGLDARGSEGIYLNDSEMYYLSTFLGGRIERRYDRRKNKRKYRGPGVR